MARVKSQTNGAVHDRQQIVVTPQKTLSKRGAKPKPSEVVIPGIEILRFQIRIIGDSPFISHAWSQKAVQMIEDKQAKRASAGRTIRDPDKEVEESVYWNAEGKPCIPAIQFKSAAVEACTQLDNMTKTFARGAFHVNLTSPLIVIEGKMEARKDMVRVGMGVADVRYRAQFWPWSCVLDITYNQRAISKEQIANLLNVAGFSLGVGDWRPQKDGSFGMFHVASV